MMAAASSKYQQVPTAPGWPGQLEPTRTFTLLQSAGDAVDELLDDLLGSALQQVRSSSPCAHACA
jgi:hypothetical protein